MAITIDDVIRGGFFTITTDKGETHCYKVEILAARGRLPAQWFVRYCTPNESFYVGRLNREFGSVELTTRSHYTAEQKAFRLVDRVMQALFGGRLQVVEQAGYSVRKGTPLDNPVNPPPAPVVSGNSTIARNRPDVGTLVMLQYDIPLVFNYVNGRRVGRYCFPNPSWCLRRIGFRVTKSVWAVQESRMPWPLLDEMTAAGVKWRVADFSDKSVEKLLEWAVEYFQEETKRGDDQLQQDIANAEQSYNEALEDDTVGPDKAAKAHQLKVRGAINRARKLAQDLAVAAKNLGITPGEANLVTLQQRVEMLADKAQARAACYADAVKQLSAMGSQFTTAAQEGDVPAGVLADMIEDAGGDASDLRNTFSDEFYDLVDEAGEETDGE